MAGSIPGNPAGQMLDAIGRGLNATQAYEEAKAAGGTIRGQRWYALWGEIQADLANRGGIVDLPRGAVIPNEMHSPWSAGEPGRYGYQAQVFTSRDVQNAEGQTYTVIQPEHATVISDVPLTPDQVAQLATDQYAGSPQHAKYGTAIVGATVTAAYQMIGVQE